MDFLTNPEVTVSNAVFKLALSMLLGAAIGIERRRKGQIAGMRTFALISMGATLAMLVSIYIPQEYMGLKNGDPGRVAAQVISGIGFLGAGAIIQSRGSVKGLTTAAGIWMTAAIGLAVGTGMYLVAIAAAALIILMLTCAEKIEFTLFHGSESKIVRAKVDGIVTDILPFRRNFSKHNVHISNEFIRYDYFHKQTIINFIIRTTDEPDFISLFQDIHSQGDIISLTLDNEVNN